MSSSSKVPDQFLNTFEVRSGTNIPADDNNGNVPPEYLYCFNVDGDAIMSDAAEETAPGLVDIVDMEWVHYTGTETGIVATSPQEPNLKRLMDLGYYKVNRSTAKSLEVVPIVSTERVVKVVQKANKGSENAKTRGPYNSYSPHKIQELIDLVFLSGFSARKAAFDLGFAVRTAQHYCRQYRLDDDKVLPGKKYVSKPNNRKLSPEHTKFLADYFDSNVTGTLWQARDALYEKFGFSLSLSAIHNHLVSHCTVTVKKLEKIPAARVTDRVINLRKQVVEEWAKDPEMDFTKNCVFIDEAGFNMHLRRNFGRSKIGTPAKAVVPTNRGISITIFGAIYHGGILDLTLRRPQPVSQPKKRKRNNGSSEENVEVNARIGSRTEHYLEFITGLMDTLDANNMKGKCYKLTIIIISYS
jgi:transposase